MAKTTKIKRKSVVVQTVTPGKNNRQSVVEAKDQGSTRVRFRTGTKTAPKEGQHIDVTYEWGA